MPSRSGSFTPASSGSNSEREAVDNGEKSRKPDNTAFKQQRLPAWQPILTAQSVLPGFFIISLIFIPVGIILLLASNEILEVSVDYTTICTSVNNQNCANLRSNTSLMTEPCLCNVTISVDRDMNGEVYVYYGLTNFFQNHRRYVKSRDDVQLNGQDISSVSGDCAPYNVDKLLNDTPIAPCGAIANSLFNDSFALAGSLGNVTINLTGIAWSTDKNEKFRNPGNPNEPLQDAFVGFTKPPFWQKPVYQLDPDDRNNNGYVNEGFIVWMRTAAFPSFRKAYGRIPNGLPRGNYTVTVQYNYPVVAFDGTKRFILSTTSWIGGKNNFLGIAYIVVGSICFATAIALCVVHHVTKKTSTTAPR